MSDLTKEQLKEGKKVLEGPSIYFWVLAVLTGIAFLTQNSSDFLSKGLNFGWVTIGLPGTSTIGIFVALYVAALIGLHMRKSWAVPVGRAGLVVSMVIFFPVGTIFGAILWKRFNDPTAKRYLDYKIDGAATDEAATTAKTTAAGGATAEIRTAGIAPEEKPDSKPEE